MEKNKLISMIEKNEILAQELTCVGYKTIKIIIEFFFEQYQLERSKREEFTDYTSGMNGYTAPEPKQESAFDDSKCPF